MPDSAVKSALRAGYRTALLAHALVSGKAPAGAGDQARVYFGGARSGDAGGTLVKIKRLREYFPEHRWDYNLVYLLSNAPYLTRAALQSIRRKGIPIVLNQNGVFYPAWYPGNWQAQNARMADAYHLADHVFWQSSFCRLSAERYLGNRAGSADVLYNAVDINRFRPTDGTPGAAEAGRPFRFLLAGRVTQGIAYRSLAAIRGLSLLRRRGVDAKMKIAGAIDPGTGVEALIDDLDLGGHVELAGPYAQSEAPAVFRSADAYVLLTHNDACPNSVIEALASGLPVLHTSTGGTPELVGETAGVCLRTEPSWEAVSIPEDQDIARGMTTIIENHDMMAAAARQRATERFSMDAWISRHRDIFSKLTGAAA